jgi:signal transduction histidine kinase
VVPVRHQGELLGALSVHKAPGDPMTPTEGKLLADVASQAGLVLRNVRLIEDLRASRHRLVAAQDEERRKIERNIHDGAQQQLVALAVRLNLAQSTAAREPARVGPMLEQLKAEAQEALENLRDLARGVYPPLLADQGLVAALTAQARKSPVPVRVEAGGIGRFDQEAEAAVYFCALEALQNVAKYAGATGATVHLYQVAGHLTFDVTDDGIGFDPTAKAHGTGMQGMADRLAALGGELRVTSAPGNGTRIEGRMPIGRLTSSSAP